MVEPPKDPLTSEELPPESRNWPEIEWEGGSLDSNPLYRYPYGGEEHRHEPALDDELPLNPQDAAQMNPLSRPMASWSRKTCAG